MSLNFLNGLHVFPEDVRRFKDELVGKSLVRVPATELYSNYIVAYGN